MPRTPILSYLRFLPASLVFGAVTLITFGCGKDTSSEKSIGAGEFGGSESRKRLKIEDPNSIALIGDDLYVADRSMQVQIFDKNLRFKSVFLDGSDSVSLQWFYLAGNIGRTIFIVQDPKDLIIKFDPLTADFPWNFIEITGLGLDERRAGSKELRIYGAMLGLQKELLVLVNNYVKPISSMICEINEQGEITRLAASKPGEIWRRGMAMDSNGNIFLANSNDIPEIVVLDKIGREKKRWSNFGTRDGQFDVVEGLAFDKNGNLYMSDNVNRRIQKFDSNGKFLAKWDFKKTHESPELLVVDDENNIFVVCARDSDSLNSTVKKILAGTNKIIEMQRM